MFGLMRPKRQCSTSAQQNPTYLLHRQHYCGTCKAIGKTFDQKSRLMLNFDTVFLAELLSELNQHTSEQWESNLQKVNTCFSMPQEEELPFALHYAAHASALLGALKIDDNIKDEGKLYWKVIRHTYRKTFKKAYQKLEDWGLDVLAIHQHIAQQVQLEKEPLVVTDNLEQHLLCYAEPTAKITAQLFALGGDLLESQAELSALGLAFGQLMYILDAFEDYERDVFEGAFNPLAIYWNHKRSLPPSALEPVRSLLLTIERRICHQIQQLPISTLAQERFVTRLSANLALRIYKERVTPKTFQERLAFRWQAAKETADRLTCPAKTWSRQMNFYMIAVAVFINPEAQSYLPQEGKWEVFKWGVFFTTLLATLGLVPILRKSRKERRQERRDKRRQGKWYKRLLKKLSPKHIQNTCCADCCSGCGQCCNDNQCCSQCFDSCCNNLCDEEYTCLDAVYITILVLLGIALLTLILFLTGVI